MDPQFALAYMALVDQYFLIGDRRHSNELMVKLDPLQSRLPRYEQLLLQTLKDSHSRDEEAEIRARQELLTQFPRDSENRGILSHDLAYIGQQDQALDVIRQGLALDAKNEDLLNFESYVLAKWGDFDGALKASDAYIAVRPGDPNPLDGRGDILFMAGRDDDAVAAYRKALETEAGLQRLW